MQCGCSDGDFLSKFRREVVPEPLSEAPSDAVSDPLPQKKKKVTTEATKKKNRDRNKATRLSRREAGLCTECGGPKTDQRWKCETCSAEMNAKAREVYWKRMAEQPEPEDKPSPSDKPKAKVSRLPSAEKLRREQLRAAQRAALKEAKKVEKAQRISKERDADPNNWRKAGFRERVAEGKCPYCGEFAPFGRQLCEKCCAERRGYKNERLKEGKCVNCTQPNDRPDRVLCTACNNKRKDSMNAKNKALKDEVFARYGGYTCACCGESNEHFLQIDHVNNDGGKHRKEVGSGTAVYRDLKERGFPEGFQVLCANCNWGKRRNGVCPHKWECKAPDSPAGGTDAKAG